MPFDPTIAAERYATLAAATPEAPPGGWPRRAPRRDVLRSPAAYLVTCAAAAEGIDLHHFEHLTHLEIPEAWLHEGHPGAESPAWSGGVLPEAKYHSFRHDQTIGGFHPGHRGKWSTHELCHGLVGFAWSPTATPFFHILAARLAELLPVVLYYFLDEAHLRRCPRHAYSGALYRSFCRECESLAGFRPDDPRAPELLEQAARFLDRDLATCARSRRTGRTISHAWAGIDLASDAMAYVDAHLIRLQSPAFHRFADGFLVEGGGWFTRLDDLEDRIVAVARHLTEGEPLAPLAPSRAHGYWRWVIQDLAWRLLTLWTETDGDAQLELERILDRLSRAIRATADLAEAAVHSVAEVAIVEAIAAYRALHQEVFVPEPEALFAVGYPLPEPGFGSDIESLTRGIASAAPLTADCLSDRLAGLVAEFAPSDPPVRLPLGERWARWLTATHPCALADLARYEATLGSLAPILSEAHLCDEAATGVTARLAEGARIEHFETDVQALVERAMAGNLTLSDTRDLELVDPPADTPCSLIFVPDAQGSVTILEVEAETAEALQRLDAEGREVRLDPELVDHLLRAKVVVPASFHEGTYIDPSLETP